MLFLCAKGDASKSCSEIDSFARSMEDVNGSKKDLSASAGEACPSAVHTACTQTTYIDFSSTEQFSSSLWDSFRAPITNICLNTRHLCLHFPLSYLC